MFVDLNSMTNDEIYEFQYYLNTKKKIYIHMFYYYMQYYVIYVIYLWSTYTNILESVGQYDHLPTIIFNQVQLTNFKAPFEKYSISTMKFINKIPNILH